MTVKLSRDTSRHLIRTPQHQSGEVGGPRGRKTEVGVMAELVPQAPPPRAESPRLAGDILIRAGCSLKVERFCALMYSLLIIFCSRQLKRTIVLVSFFVFTIIYIF